MLPCEKRTLGLAAAPAGFNLRRRLYGETRSLSHSSFPNIDWTASAAQMWPGGGALPAHHLHLAYWGKGSQYLAGRPVNLR